MIRTNDPADEPTGSNMPEGMPPFPEMYDIIWDTFDREDQADRRRRSWGGRHRDRASTWHLTRPDARK